MLAGYAWGPAVAVGLSLALSSTAIVLQTLTEKGWLNQDAGQNAFSVLLFFVNARYRLPVAMLLTIPALIEVFHGALYKKNKDAPYMKTWYWVCAILVSTALLILLRAVR